MRFFSDIPHRPATTGSPASNIRETPTPTENGRRRHLDQSAYAEAGPARTPLAAVQTPLDAAFKRQRSACSAATAGGGHSPVATAEAYRDLQAELNVAPDPAVLASCALKLPRPDLPAPNYQPAQYHSFTQFFDQLGKIAQSDTAGTNALFRMLKDASGSDGFTSTQAMTYVGDARFPAGGFWVARFPGSGPNAPDVELKISPWPYYSESMKSAETPWLQDASASQHWIIQADPGQNVFAAKPALALRIDLTLNQGEWNIAGGECSDIYSKPGVSGTWLMQLFTALAQHLQLPRVILHDAAKYALQISQQDAKKYCILGAKDGSVEVMLRTLLPLALPEQTESATARTWYGKYGFCPMDVAQATLSNTSHAFSQDVAAYNAAINVLRNRPMSALLEAVRFSVVKSDKPRVAAILKDYATSPQAMRQPTFADVLQWLYARVRTNSDASQLANTQLAFLYQKFIDFEQGRNNVSLVEDVIQVRQALGTFCFFHVFEARFG